MSEELWLKKDTCPETNIISIYRPDKNSSSISLKWGSDFQRMDLAERLETITKIIIELSKDSVELTAEFSRLVSEHRFE